MELYHLLNRGVEKRDIFMDDSDRARFVHDLYEFNDSAPAGNAYRRFDPRMMEIRSPSFEREQIVDVHGWCLMGNHYHLLVSERREGGLVSFARKLNVGYAMYFNEKHDRSGVLFQGRTKKIRVSTDAHFLYVLHYIHLNPLDFSEHSASWREKRVRSARAALEHLDTYRWSSYLDYTGVKNFPSVITTSLFKDVFKNYKKEIAAYLSDLEIAPIKDLFLE